MGNPKKQSPHTGAKLERIIEARAHHWTKADRKAAADFRALPVSEQIARLRQAV